MGNQLNIKAKFDTRTIRATVNKYVQNYINRVIEVYKTAGVAMVEDARSRTKDLGAYDGGSFGNITWNLRSSIGCSLFRGGDAIFDYYPTLQTGAHGSKKGKDFALETYRSNVGITYSKDSIVLIVVAGEDYARAVESRGYNVIDATANIAEEILLNYILKAAA